MKKKILISIILVLIILLFFFISKNVIKKSKNGNDISSQKIVDKILNIKHYKAEIDVEIKSNKNKNRYIILQEYEEGKINTQEIIEPSNLKGIVISKNEEKIIIKNTELGLNKIYENYEELENNDLDLYSFLDQYKKDSNSYFEEKNEKILLHCENKILYIKKENNIPEELIIVDNNRKIKINIKYNNIEL